MRKKLLQPIFVIVTMLSLSGSILGKGVIDDEIEKIKDDLNTYSFLKPEENFLKSEKTDIFSSGKIEHEKINEKIDYEENKDNALSDMALRDFVNISLLQKGSKCITAIKNGKCACDGHKKNISEIAKENSNAVKLIFSQMNMKKTNLRGLNN